MAVRILVGDVRERLAELPDESVHCVVTSPPYWALRDYGVAGQLGLEATPAEHVAAMVGVFREVRRVLRSDGVMWMNYGDSYASRTDGSHGGWNGDSYKGGENPQRTENDGNSRRLSTGLKPKDLVGMPWRVAFALQADGWYLRSDVIWSKPNPMPESVTDRPTKSHEYVFLFAKGQSRTRSIDFADVEPERVHFGRYLGAQRQSMSDTTRLSVGLATSVFYAAQLEKDFSLPPFYSEEWKQGLDGHGGLLVSDLPPRHRAAAHAARLLNADASTKEFLCEMHGLWGGLRDRDHLLIGRALSECADPPGVLVDGNTAIAVNNASKPGKVDFVHARIIVTVPMTCKYFYDADAVREVTGLEATPEEYASADGHRMPSGNLSSGVNSGFGAKRSSITHPMGRNLRSVWSIPTHAFPGAHFATFPPKLVETCIKAGCPEGGTVLDPFGGAGTTGLVADRLGRDAILIELNPEYAEIARKRIHDDLPMFADVEKE